MHPRKPTLLLPGHYASIPPSLSHYVWGWCTGTFAHLKRVYGWWILGGNLNPYPFRWYDHNNRFLTVLAGGYEIKFNWSLREQQSAAVIHRHDAGVLRVVDVIFDEIGNARWFIRLYKQWILLWIMQPGFYDPKCECICIALTKLYYAFVWQLDCKLCLVPLLFSLSPDFNPKS